MSKIEFTKEDLAVIDKAVTFISTAKNNVSADKKIEEYINEIKNNMQVVQSKLHNQMDKALEVRVESDSMGKIECSCK